MAQERAGGIVELSVAIRAEPATVFRFFSDPVRFARWWATPGGGKATIEPREGGTVRIEYVNGPAMSGRVVEMRAPERLVMTWGYERGNDAVGAGASRVEVTLRPTPEGTLLTLRHTGLPNEEQRTGHEFGWRYYLSVVGAEASHDQFAEAAGRSMDAWFRAWGTADAAERRGVLESCFEAGGSFRDAFSCIDGLDNLNAHITNSRRHMPGIVVGAAGPVQELHGHVRVPWRATGPGGQVMFAGVNFAELSLGGKIGRMVGFWDTPAG